LAGGFDGATKQKRGRRGFGQQERQGRMGAPGEESRVQNELRFFDMNNCLSPRRFAFGDKGTFGERRRNTSNGSAAQRQYTF
jgi:hypothetical protein